MNFYKYLSPLLVLSLTSCSLTLGRSINQKSRTLRLGKAHTLPQKDKLEWHLKATQAEKAWQISKGNKDTIVAIIDTGIDTNHIDLKNNLWVNEAEKNGVRGVDDDQNGFVDDIHGWNFADHSSNVMDYHGHGTHVAGIIGGQGKFCRPGIAPNVSLMILKYYSERSSSNLENTIRSIKYAVDNGAHIINFSGGGSQPNKKEKIAIQNAFQKNILFVTAAGNQGNNIDQRHYYPASYDLPNILSVGSSDKKDSHSNFSNRGEAVQVHAPGTKIYSTLPNGRCGFLTGTSQATPIFSGGAVLLKNHKDIHRPSEIIKYLTKSADYKASLKGKSQTGGRANFYKALSLEDFGVAVSGKKVKYSSDSGASSDQKAGYVMNSEEEGSYSLFQLQEDLSKTKVKQAKKKDVETARTPASFEEFSDFLIDPSALTKAFLEAPKE